MSVNLKQLGKRIRNNRVKKGITQDKLSELVDKSPPYISYIECGNKSMSIDTLVDIANALNVSADELLKDSLKNNIVATNHTFSQITADCNEQENRIIESIVSATKSALRNEFFKN